MSADIADTLVDAYRDILRVKAAVADVKPGTHGIVGKGTPGSRLKSRHRNARSSNAHCPGLRRFARSHATIEAPHVMHVVPGSPSIKADALAWMASKGVQS